MVDVPIVVISMMGGFVVKECLGDGGADGGWVWWAWFWWFLVILGGGWSWFGLASFGWFCGFCGLLWCLAMLWWWFGGFSMGFWLVLSGLPCEWWWILVFYWVYGLWVMLAGSSGELLLGRIERWERREKNRFFFLILFDCVIYIILLWYM